MVQLGEFVPVGQNAGVHPLLAHDLGEVVTAHPRGCHLLPLAGQKEHPGGCGLLLAREQAKHAAQARDNQHHGQQQQVENQGQDVVQAVDEPLQAVFTLYLAHALSCSCAVLFMRRHLQALAGAEPEAARRSKSWAT